MNLIQAEKNAAKRKMINLIPGTNLVDLTRDNVAIITAMISTDSAYRFAIEKNAGPKGSFDGTSAFWYDQLKQYAIEHKRCDFVYEGIIMNIVAAVDRENSIHLNSGIIIRAGYNPQETFTRTIKVRLSLYMRTLLMASRGRWIIIN